MSNAAVRWVETEAEHRRVRMPDALADRQSTRFVWQAREDVPHGEVLGGVIERCRVMPIIKLLRWDRIDDVPLEYREPGMIRGTDVVIRQNKEGGSVYDWGGKPGYAAYATLPGYILDAILEQYRGHGVVELTALRGMDAAAFGALKIDDLFFPERKSVDKDIDEIPQTYAELRFAIESRMHAAQINGLGYSSQQMAVIRNCADEMLQAIKQAERYDNALVDESEGELELGRNNPQYKQKYDQADLAALKRVGRLRRDAFMKRLAEQQFDLQVAVKEAITEKSQGANVLEIAQAVGTSVAAEFAKIFASQRGIPVVEVIQPKTPEPAPAAEIEQPKPAPQSKQPKFQQNK